MKKKEIVLLALILLLASALVATFFYIQHVQSRRIAETYVHRIQKIDRFLAQGATEKAEAGIIELAHTDVSAATYLQLLKRSFTIARQPDSTYAVFLEVADKGHSSYPARDDLSALLIYGHLRSGNVQTAIEVYRSTEIQEPRWNPIVAEVKLAAGEIGKGPGQARGKKSTKEKAKEKSDEVKKDEAKQNEGEGYLYNRILQSEKPELFEEAWEKTELESFLLDAVLLHLLDGNVYRAEELSKNLPKEGLHKLHFFLAYDTESWSDALSYLDKVPVENGPKGFTEKEKLLLEADIEMRRGDSRKAKKIYLRLAENYPDNAWEPLYNAAFIRYTETGELEEDGAELITDRLHELSRGKPRRVTEIAEMMLAYGDEEHAEKLLTGGNTNKTMQAHIRLLREKAKNSLNPERYKSLLRILVNQEGGRKYASHLAWFLLGIDDYRGLGELIAYYRQVYGEEPWLQFYRAILYAENEEYEKALSSFSLSLERKEYWQTYYNMALVSSLQKDISRAESLLEKALERTEKEDHRAVILAKRAEIRFRYGNTSTAKSDAQSALDLDPSNTTAQLVLNALESAGAQ